MKLIAVYHRKTKNIAQNQNFCKNYVIRNIKQRKFQVSEKSLNSCKDKQNKTFLGPKLGLNCPLGSRNSSSEILAWRTIHLYFVDVKFQFLGICRSRLYPEETTVFFGSRPNWIHFWGFGAITQVKNVRFSRKSEQRQSSQLYKCHLKHFEKIEFLQRQDVPKF